MWCVQAKKFANNRFDVPDFMHVQGLYETRMSTEAFSSVDEYAESKALQSNTRTGTSSFSEEKEKFSKYSREWFPRLVPPIPHLSFDWVNFCK